MNDQVEEIKSKTDIVSVISEHVDLKKAGRNYKAPCPFHPEKTPSFMVSPELQIFKCFGCGESGDVFSFLEKYEGMEFYEALKYLADKTGVKLKTPKFDEGGTKERLYNVNSNAAYFYSYVLLKHTAGKEAYNYLTRERRIDPEVIKAFSLGYSPMTPLALSNFLTGKKHFSPVDLEKAGITYGRGRDLVDRFRGRIIFPLFDHRGNTVGFAGRILPREDNKDLAKYINSPETEIYHKSKVLYGLNLTRSEIKRVGEAVIVEGELDMISTYQTGIKNVVAIKGSAVTFEQARLLSRFCKKVTLALDTDFAGNEAARRGLDILQAEGLEVRVCTLGEFKDPDEAAHKAPEKLAQLIKDSKLVWDFVIDMIFEKYKNESLQKVAKELTLYLSSIKDEIVRAHYINRVSQRLKVPFEAVSKEVQKILNSSSQRSEKEAVALGNPTQKSRLVLLEERLMSLFFARNPEILANKKFEKFFSSPLLIRIKEEYIKYSEKNKKFDLKDFSKALPGELVPGFSEIILNQTDEIDEDTPDNTKKELEIVERELDVLKIKKKLSELGVIIQELEQKKEIESLKKAQEKFGKLTKKLNSLVDIEIKGIIS